MQHAIDVRFTGGHTNLYESTSNTPKNNFNFLYTFVNIGALRPLT